MKSSSDFYIVLLMLSVMISLGASGCAQTIRWAGKPATEFNQDNYRCKYESESTRQGSYSQGAGIAGALGNPQPGLYGAVYAQSRVQELYEACMEAKGWYKVQQ